MRAPILLVCVLIGCSPAPEPVSPDEDPGYTGGEAEWCDDACDLLVETGCSIGCDSPGPTCLAECLLTCAEVEGSGTVSLRPKCISKLKTLTPPGCQEMETCR